jgi:Cysteine rich repeat
MTRIAIVAAALLLSSLTSALAQEITAAERTACQTDYDKYCKGTFPGGGRIIRCLASHYETLGDACKKVVDANKK